MTRQLPSVIKDYTVRNPRFYEDVIKFMELGCTEAEARERIEKTDAENPLNAAQIASGDPTLKGRLNALMNRVEFIYHLELISRFAEESKSVILGKEVDGIGQDIEALRVYLAVTCIDIFCEKDNHRAHFEQIFSGLTDEVAKLVGDGLSLKEADGTTGDMKAIGVFFYNIRNYYTHAGRRFHILPASSFRQEQRFLSGSRKDKKEWCLVVEDNVDLVDILLRVAISTAKRRFEWQAD